MAIAPVALLTAREHRAARQGAALARYGKPLLAITVVMPGPAKDGALARSVMKLALDQVDRLVRARHWTVLSRDVSWHESGPEAIYSLDVDGQVLKSLAIDLEERYPIGRLWDLDVIAPGGVGLSRARLG